MVRIAFFLGCISAALAATLSVRNSTCSPGPIIANNRQCTIECGVDHAGGDYSSLAVADFQGCIDACSGAASCLTAQYLVSNSYCYLKNAVNGASSNPNVNGIVCQSSAASSISATSTSSSSSTSTSSTCSAGPTTIQGRTAIVECNVDRPGGDYANRYAQTFAVCEGLCASNGQCWGAQYDTINQWCYLKSTVLSPQSKANVWGIVMRAYAPTTSTSSPTPSTSSTLTTSSPSTSTSTSTSTNTSTNTSTSTSTSTTTSTTSASSTSTSSSTIATTSTTTTSASTTTSTSSTATSTVSSTSNPAAACTGAYVQVAGRTGAVQCGVDRPYNDIATASADSLQTCETLCATNDQCQVAHYVPASQICYQKTYVGTPQYNSSVNGIVFYNATYPEYYCINPAPPSPWLLNGGFEERFLDVQPGPDGIAGTFQQSVTSDYGFEGCYSLVTYPTTATGYRYISTTMKYSNLQVGTKYNLRFTSGRETSDTSPNNAPTIQVLVQGSVVLFTSLCGFKNTANCPVQGNKGAWGETSSGYFTAKNSTGTIEFVMYWYNTASDQVVLDDIRLSPS